MSRRGRHSRRIGASRATIDMNSLIDLTFLLLVTFILTITQMQMKDERKLEQSNISINLPGAQAAENAEAPVKDTTITVKKKEGEKEGAEENVDLFFNDIKISPDDLAKKLEEQVKEEEEKKAQGIEEDSPVFVRGDNDVRYEDMMKVMEIVRKAGVKRMSFVTVKE